MARSAKPKADATLTSNRERPAQPKPFNASKDDLLGFYKQMMLIRRFEERAGQLYGLGLIGLNTAEPDLAKACVAIEAL